MKTESLLVEFSGKIIYEREPDLSDDESALYEKKLTRSFDDLKLKHYSIIYIQGVLEGQEEDSNIYIQILEDSTQTENWSAKYIKKGIRKPVGEEQEVSKTAPVNESATFEIDDDMDGLECQTSDAFANETGLGKKRLSVGPATAMIEDKSQEKRQKSDWQVQISLRHRDIP